MMPYFDENKIEWEVYHRKFDGWYFLHMKFDSAKNPNWLVLKAWPREPSGSEVWAAKGIAMQALSLFVDHTNYCEYRESVAAMEAEQ
ncbi:MAG: hypothetical protein PHE87_10790 [Victivallaceae bacterium]|nr:hypothetical protein [Victivallaceae bacterium]